jgi:hypothetical protein
MSESEIMDYGIRKGYIGEDGSLIGPQQFSDQTLPPGVIRFCANMASGPIQWQTIDNTNNLQMLSKEKYVFRTRC